MPRAARRHHHRRQSSAASSSLWLSWSSRRIRKRSEISKSSSSSGSSSSSIPFIEDHPLYRSNNQTTQPYDNSQRKGTKIMAHTDHRVSNASRQSHRISGASKASRQQEKQRSPKRSPLSKLRVSLQKFGFKGQDPKLPFGKDEEPTEQASTNGMPVFTITYSKSERAGIKEYQSAATCVRSIFPESEIIAREVQRLPIRVTITADWNGDGPFKIWQGQQQNLFRSDVPTRTLTMREITHKLETFRYKIGMT